jgi:uncharacterized protein with HEPN domain
MKRDIGLYLDDILQSIKRIKDSTLDLTLEQFIKDLDIQDAIIRRIEIMGESAKQIPEEYKTQHPEVPWRKITGTRDVFIHDYFEVNLERIWDIIQNDLIPLKEQVEAMLKEQDS